MRPVNLIPQEERRGPRAPTRTGPVAYVLVAALLALLIGVWQVVATGNTVEERKAQVTVLEQDLASAQARAEALRSFSDFASLEQARTQTVSSLARSRFDWQRVMREMGLVIPKDVWLVQLLGSAGGENAAAGAGAPDVPGGEEILSPNLTLIGCGLSHDAVARFAASLRDIDGVTRVGVTSSDRGKIDEATGGGGAEGGSDINCRIADFIAQFTIIVTFDEVQVDDAGAVTAPPAPPESGATPDDGSGVAEAEAEKAAGNKAVEKADQETQEAVNLVPGA